MSGGASTVRVLLPCPPRKSHSHWHLLQAHSKLPLFKSKVNATEKVLLPEREELFSFDPKGVVVEDMKSNDVSEKGKEKTESGIFKSGVAWPICTERRGQCF